MSGPQTVGIVEKKNRVSRKNAKKTGEAGTFSLFLFDFSEPVPTLPRKKVLSCCSL